MTTNTRFESLIDDAISQSFSGWDFSWVKGRLTEAETSWSYRDLAKSRLAHAEAMVDLCTGGGEFLESLGELPNRSYATEGYEPNVSVARKRLEPRGVQVVQVYSDDELPLPSETFDLVINRHGTYSPRELLRITTTSDAWFLTQQVGAGNAYGLNEAFNAPSLERDTWCLETAVEQLVSLGFRIARSEEEFPRMSFLDVGAVVFYLKAIPWQIPDFDVSAYHEQLLDIHNRIEANGSFDVSAHRFLIEAKLP